MARLGCTALAGYAQVAAITFCAAGAPADACRRGSTVSFQLDLSPPGGALGCLVVCSTCRGASVAGTSRLVRAAEWLRCCVPYGLCAWGCSGCQWG